MAIILIHPVRLVPDSLNKSLADCYQITSHSGHHLLIFSIYNAPDCREGVNKHCFCPSVCLSVHCVHSE